MSVEVLQDQTQLMLHEYCASSSVTGRFGKVLLVLPALRAIQNASLVDLFFRKLIGDTPMARLLADLLMGSLV